MKTKSLKFYILSFFTFLIYLSISSHFFLNYQKNLLTKELHFSIEKRLLDYQSIFSILQSKITTEDDMRALSPYSQQQIYLKGNAVVILGELECKFVNTLTARELSGWKDSNSTLQEKLLKESGVIVATHAYRSLDMTDELVVDLGYSFESDSYKGMLKTTVLVQDLLYYNKLPLLFIDQNKQTNFSLFSSDYYHPHLKIYIGIKVNYAPLFWYIIACIFFYIFGLCVFHLVKSQKEKTLLRQEVSLLHTENIHLKTEKKAFDFLKIGEIYEVKNETSPITTVYIEQIIAEFLEVYSEKIKEKSITFNLTDKQASSVAISTNKQALSAVLSLYLQHLIRENPPHAIISYGISVNNNLSIAKIVLEENRTFSSPLDSTFFSSKVNLPSSLQIPIGHFIEKLNAYIEFSTSLTAGNKTIIAIPCLDKGNKKPRSDSNVVPFHR